MSEQLAKTPTKRSPEEIAAWQENARRIAQERIGQAACNACPLARICSVKNPEACNPNQIAQQAGGEYTGGDSAEVSYKKVLDDDRINVVIANVRKKEQTKPKAQRPPEVQRPPANTINMPPANVIKAPPARPKMEQSTKPTVIQQIINAVGKLLDVPKANQQPARRIQK